MPVLRIYATDDDTIVIDGKYPLSGKTLLLSGHESVYWNVNTGRFAGGEYWASECRQVVGFLSSKRLKIRYLNTWRTHDKEKRHE